MIFRSLQPADDRSAFSCLDADYDDFLRRYAGQNQFTHRVSTTLVAVEDERVIGYATFALAETFRDELAEVDATKLPRYPLPALRLGRLAVDERYQGFGVGSRLMREVLAVALRLREEYGCVAVLVDALPEKRGFYESLGFEEASAVIGRGRVTGSILMTLPLTDVLAARSTDWDAPSG